MAVPGRLNMPGAYRGSLEARSPAGEAGTRRVVYVAYSLYLLGHKIGKPQGWIFEMGSNGYSVVSVGEISQSPP